jgi:iron complex outermembrane receptor protein
VTYATNRRAQEVEAFSQPHFELLNEWRLNSKLTFSNTFFYIQGDGYYDYDGSGLSAGGIHWDSANGYAGAADPVNPLVRAYVGNKQFGWLPRLEIDHNTGVLTFGAELRFHRSLHWGKIQYSENLPSNYDPDYHIYEYNGGKDMFSVYGHELYKLNGDLTLMTDLQFVYDRYTLSDEKFYHNDFAVPYYFVNPRVGINYNVDEYFNTYVNLAYTSREPRLKDLYEAESSIWTGYGYTPKFAVDTVGGVLKYDFSNPIAKPEHLYDLEVGAAYRDEHSMLAANVFWMEFQDELVKNGTLDIFGEPVMGNADRTRHIGIEIEAQTSLSNGFSVSGNATISHNRLIRYAVADSIVNGVTYRHSLDGNPIAGSPDFMANLRLTQSSANWSASIDAKYVGAFYTDNTKNDLEKNDEYIVLNASALYRFALGSGVHLTVRGEVHNLLNRLYTMTGEGQEFYPAAERNYVVGVALQL